jgi:hypothetical protein
MEQIVMVLGLLFHHQKNKDEERGCVKTFGLVPK